MCALYTFCKHSKALYCESHRRAKTRAKWEDAGWDTLSSTQIHRPIKHFSCVFTLEFPRLFTYLEGSPAALPFTFKNKTLLWVCSLYFKAKRAASVETQHLGLGSCGGGRMLGASPTSQTRLFPLILGDQHLQLLVQLVLLLSVSEQTALAWWISWYTAPYRTRLEIASIEFA